MKAAKRCIVCIGLGVLVASTGVLDAAPDARPDFTQGEVAESALNSEINLGPTGLRGVMDRDLERANQIRITSVAEGSPADGILLAGDVILGIGDAPFGDNARQRFGEAIMQAETEEAGGRLHLLRWREGETEPVTVPLEVMGTYSDTVPWGCAKSRRIVERAAAYLERRGTPVGAALGIPAMVASLGLLATGEERYLPLVRKHVETIVRRVAEAKGDALPSWQYRGWSWSYINILLNEYYVATGDRQVLPAIERYSRAIARGQSSHGTWSHGMPSPDPVTGEPLPLGGYGTVNQVSVACWLSLVLAQRNGVSDPVIDRAISNKATFLHAFVDFGSIPYGDHQASELLYDNNGVNSLAAVGFAALGDEAATAFFSRMTVASYTVRERGHTGHFWSDLWGCPGAARSGRDASAAFLHEELWRLDLERRWDGSFVFQSGGAYGNWDMTGARLIHYSLSRQQLAITGRDVVTMKLTPEEIAETIEAGRQPRRVHGWAHKYDELPTLELLPLLGSWSSVSRQQAARSLSSREDAPIETLREMLGSDNRYARYGACIALRHLGSKAQPAVEDLIALLDAEDRVLQINAIQALGRTDDPRAVEALLELVGREIENDPYEVVRNRVAGALFGRGNLSGQVRRFEDRERILDATRTFLTSYSGPTRNSAGGGLLPMLTLEEFKAVWPQIEHARKTYATSLVTSFHMAVLRRLQELRIREGIDHCVAYLTEMQGWGSPRRVIQVLDILRRYGAHARVALPELERVVNVFEQEKRGKPKAESVRKLIRELEAMEDPGEDAEPLVSIAAGGR